MDAQGAHLALLGPEVATSDSEWARISLINIAHFVTLCTDCIHFAHHDSYEVDYVPC